MALRVYNTLTRREEEFVTNEPGKVTMYVCGPTVYSDAHVGHAMAAVVFDMVRRYLMYRGYEVRYATNFTDVDDKIIRRANQTGQDPIALANHYAEEYLRHLSDLNVLPADVYPRVSSEMDQIIRFIQDLAEAGYAYEIDGDVYFRVTKDADYGKLSHRSLDEAMSGTRIGEDPRKENVADFALWKSAKPGALGGQVAQAGTSNVRPCVCTTWARPSTFMAVAMTSSSPTMKMRSPKVKA
jgi:cysteinyl-tRNA synthetase